MLTKSGKAIHEYFELTYAQYLVLPRTALQSMPAEWQREFVNLIEQLDETFEFLPHQTIGSGKQYRVIVDELVEEFDADEKDFVQKWANLDMDDPMANYERGRRRLEPKVA